MKLELGMEMVGEVAPDGISMRWKYKRSTGTFPKYELVDSGYTGVFRHGIVSVIKDSVAELIFVNESNDGIIHAIALEGHVAYIKEQWSYPGFPVPVAQPSKDICECGCEARYGKDCPGHAYWCKKYRPNPYTGM
jgi:hypothetical protein